MECVNKKLHDEYRLFAAISHRDTVISSRDNPRTAEKNIICGAFINYSRWFSFMLFYASVFSESESASPMALRHHLISLKCIKKCITISRSAQFGEQNNRKREKDGWRGERTKEIGVELNFKIWSILPPFAGGRARSLGSGCVPDAQVRRKFQLKMIIITFDAKMRSFINAKRRRKRHWNISFASKLRLSVLFASIARPHWN